MLKIKIEFLCFFFVIYYARQYSPVPNKYRKEIRHQSCIQFDALMLARSFPQTEWCAPIVTRNSSVEEQQTKINARHIKLRAKYIARKNGTQNSIGGILILDYSE